MRTNKIAPWQIGLFLRLHISGDLRLSNSVDHIKLQEVTHVHSPIQKKFQTFQFELITLSLQVGEQMTRGDVERVHNK